MHVALCNGICVCLSHMCLLYDMSSEHVYNITYHLCKAELIPRKDNIYHLVLKGGNYQSIVSENLCVVWKANYSWHLVACMCTQIWNNQIFCTSSHLALFVIWSIIYHPLPLTVKLNDYCYLIGWPLQKIGWLWNLNFKLDFFYSPFILLCTIFNYLANHHLTISHIMFTWSHYLLLMLTFVWQN